MGVSAMKAACAIRGSFSNRRNGLQSDASLADVLMPVELRSALGLGVVAVPDVNILQPDRALELIDGVGKSFVADDVVSRDVGVTGVDASARRHEVR